MRTREIIKRVKNYRDFYGGDIPNASEVKTKAQAREAIENHRNLLEDTLRDAMSHLDDFERELGLY